MALPAGLRTSLNYVGMAASVVLLGHVNMEMPGTGGEKSNFVEVALMLCIPFIPNWCMAMAVAAATIFNIHPGAPALAGPLSHVIVYPFAWLAYRKWGAIRDTPRFIATWALVIAAYYYVGLLPLVFAIHKALGIGSVGENLDAYLSASRMVAYEFLATSLVAIVFFLMMRELRLRHAIQADLQQRNIELSRHKALLQAQHDATREGILVVSADGRILSWNGRLLEIWGIDPSFIRSASPLDVLLQAEKQLLQPGDFLEAARVVAHDPEVKLEDALHLKDGRVLMRFTAPLRIDGHGSLERVWFFHDITALERAQTERRILQEQLFQSQKMEAIGQLAGGIAHDFNNALGIILGAAELAALEPLGAEARSSIDMIVSTARRSASLTRKLLSFSRKGPRTDAPVDLAALVREVASLLRSSLDRNIEITTRCDATRTLVRGDPGLLQNAFMNLGINASHAMPEGGELAFTIREASLDQQACDASPYDLAPGRYLEIETRDTGCGIPPENLSRIFDPFFTTKEAGKGTGLGLATVYGTVQEHRGSLAVDSTVGSGTSFRILLPIDPTTTDPALTFGIPEDVVPAGNATILVVDDEAMLRATTTRNLARLGYTVIQAADGQEAAEVFQMRRSEIDLVILDMVMPRDGGRKTLEALRDLAPGLPVLVASGWANPPDLDAIRALGASAFLPKPFERAQLARAVTSLLRAPASAPP